MKLKLYIFSVIFLSITAVSAQEVLFNTEIDNKEVAIDEQLHVDLEMKQSSEGFTFSGDPSQTVSKTHLQEIMYKPSSLKTSITDVVDNPKFENDITNIASENIHLVTEISKSSPYLNEAFNVVYKLYVSHETSVNNWKETSTPKFTHFWSQNIDEKNIKVQEGQYKGKPYRYVILKRTVLYPQKTGELIIEPLVLHVSTSVPTKERNAFGRFLTKDISIDVATKNTTIDVKPLPLEGKPDNFTGAVGTFDFTVKTNENSLHASDAFQLSLAVKGNGNLSLLDLPKPNLSNKLKVSQLENGDEINVSLNGMSGLKKATYTLESITNNKKYTIPSISFSYFNPKTERYEHKTSDEFVIEMN